jgi:hypothetical protein
VKTKVDFEKKNKDKEIDFQQDLNLVPKFLTVFLNSSDEFQIKSISNNPKVDPPNPQ